MVNKHIIIFFCFLFAFNAFCAQPAGKQESQVERDGKQAKEESPRAALHSPQRSASAPKSIAFVVNPAGVASMALISAVNHRTPQTPRTGSKAKLPPQRYPNHSPISDVLPGFPQEYSPPSTYRHIHRKPACYRCKNCIIA